MPIQLKCPNAGCTAILAVKEEFAGKMIKCPTCGATTVVPATIGAGAPAAVPPPPPPSAPVPVPFVDGSAQTGGAPQPPPAAGAPAGASFLATVLALCEKNNLSMIQRIMLVSGIASMALLLFSLLLPRYTTSEFIEGMLPKESWGLGLFTVGGALMLITTMLVAGFIVAAFAKMHEFLNYSFFAGAAWGILGFFFVLLLIALDMAIAGKNVTVHTGLGAFVSLLATVGMIGTFGFLSYPGVLAILKKKQ